VTDGTVANTDLLKDINPGSTGASIVFLGVGPGVAYFRANDGSNGVELWKTDGTGTGTVIVRNIASGSTNSDPSAGVFFVDKFWFTATDSGGEELWSTDGTNPGTLKLEVNPSTSIGSNPSNLTVQGGYLYFTANGGDGAGNEIWRTDGTQAGTVRVTDAAPGAADGVSTIGPWDGRRLYFFSASHDTTELWATDGTPAGTYKVKDFCAAPMCYPYAQFIDVVAGN
jgi:ELWxxDGT repeat protein